MSFIRDSKAQLVQQGQAFLSNKQVLKDSLLSLAICHPNIAVLNFGNIAVRRDYPTYDCVKIISGGPSGHEPAHGAYVGRGMLTVAVQGDIFISPSSNDILRAIREVTYKQKTVGAVIIAPNDTGTCLNFTVAAQMAANEGVRLKLLMVKDDVSHPTGNGLAGVVLVQKIAGALAEASTSMDDIEAFCQQVCADLFTVMVTLKPCRSPTVDTCICRRHFGPHDLQLGAGLHGESLGENHQLTSIEDLCKLLLTELTQNPQKPLHIHHSAPVVVLINNLGNTSLLEQHLFVKALLEQLQSLEVSVARLYCGHYMTSLDTSGFTVSILTVSNARYLQLLDAATEAPGWLPARAVDLNTPLQPVVKTRIKDKRPVGPRGPALNESQANLVELVVQFACDALISCEKQLNTIDSETGDGDTGTRLKCGVQEVSKLIEAKSVDFAHPFNLLVRLSAVFETAVSGTLGCIYSIFFEAAANVFFGKSEEDVVDANTWLSAFANAVHALRWHLNVEPGGRTMLDPLFACVNVVNNRFSEGIDVLESLDDGLKAAEEAVLQTKTPDRKYADPGAHAVGIWMRAVFEGIKLRCN